MSLKRLPSLLEDYAARYGDEAPLPDWMQVAAAMVAVSEELGTYTGADNLALASIRQQLARRSDDDEIEHMDVDHRARFLAAVERVMLILTRRGGLATGDGTLYDPTEIANALAEDDVSITPSHVRQAQYRLKG